MKKGILCLTVLFTSMLVFQTHAQEIIDGPAIAVNKETHDFGDLAFAAHGACEFVVTNIGNEPLLIELARPSCGCTVPEYSKEPILPRASTSIKVSYNTNRAGSFSKTITFVSNAVNDPNKVVVITGNVAPQPAGFDIVTPDSPPVVAPTIPNVPRK